MVDDLVDLVPIVFFGSYKPPAPLSDFVENLWAYRGFESPRFKERIFPSGTFEIVFNLRGDEMRICNASRSNAPILDRSLPTLPWSHT